MPDREKVINALGRCESYGYCEDKRCPYYEDTSCLESMRKDALELLKERRPHLLTPDEADVAEVVWFEVRNQTHIEPMLTGGKRFADETADWSRYGRDWRCWSARPTYTQREEEPWDG